MDRKIEIEVEADDKVMDMMEAEGGGGRERIGKWPMFDRHSLPPQPITVLCT